MELKVIEYEVRDGVATVQFNRPGRGNSWTSRMNAEYRWCMGQADEDPAVRVIVLTGAGRQFCVGADFKALDYYAEGDKDYLANVSAVEFAQPGYGVRSEFDHELVWLWGLQKPVIAAINGACAGIAVAIAGFCDLRYGVAGAKFTTVAPRIGLPAEYGLSYLLPRLVGVTHAADILLTGRVFTAEEAMRMGYLNDVFPAETFEARITEIAAGMTRNLSPTAVRTAKRQLYAELTGTDIGQSVELSKRLIGEAMRTSDFREGVEALQAKRLPNFADLGTTRRGDGAAP